MPSGLIHEQDRVGIWRDRRGNLREMQVHRFGGKETPGAQWLLSLLAKKPVWLDSVALANKTERTAMQALEHPTI